MLKVYDIDIKGLVQGVGFRPYIYRLAKDLNLKGFVDNRTAGVKVILQASSADKDEFIRRVQTEKPDVAKITQISIIETKSAATFDTFRIAPSKREATGITRVSPDIAVCKDCLRDLSSQPHRINYPFINCTHCGPRFSIVESIPYDRPSTTMRIFDMCHTCKEEYENPEDRRFHAQPVACNHCGPSYSAFIDGQWINNYSTIISNASECLKKGGIIALKGIGGFNWITDASSAGSITRLRELKHRYSKPFALLCRDMDWINENLFVSDTERQELISWRRAILILNEKKKLSGLINGELDTLGVMLPYMPVHYDLFSHTDIPAFILTSANLPGEPMLTDNDEARAYLLEKSDLYIENNRPIHNRVDDSVVRVINNKTQILRRARGYTPEPIPNTDTVEGGLAFGAEMTSVFAIGKGNDILLSQYIGNLSENEALEAYKITIDRFSALFRFKPSFLVCDLHPGYYSSRYAEEMSEKMSLPLYKVQHHHAHAVSVMIEHNIESTCIALCLDGTGLGDDGASWGGELLLCSRTTCERLWHLPYVALPGGDKASEECWRMAVSYLFSFFTDVEKYLPQDFCLRIGKERTDPLIRLLKSPLNQYKTSSMGRLFDAVSSLTGICDYNSFQAEAAMRLEHLASKSDTNSSYSCNGEETCDLKIMLEGVLTDLTNKTDKADIARKFHNTIAEILAHKVLQASDQTHIKDVLLSGGVFQNKLLSELLIKLLEERKLKVYYPSDVPCNDGGIAAGQLAIVAAYLKNNKLK